MKLEKVIGVVVMFGGVLAQEAANPFVAKEEERREAAAAGPREPCELVVEHVLVPTAVLNGWLDAREETDDATLHEQVRRWVGEGVAELDHTAMIRGMTGSKMYNEMVIEQIYPTEFLAGGIGAWPLPAAFEARNVGYSASGSLEGNGEGIAVDTEAIVMRPDRFQHPLVDRTRLPGDVFIPTFEHFRAPTGGDEPDIDPFAAPNSPPKKIERQAEIFQTDGPRLWARYDDWKTEAGDVSKSRLVFIRASILKKEDAAEGSVTRLQLRVFRVAHRDFSEWLWSRPVGSDDAWVTARAWRAEDTGGLGGPLLKSGATFEASSERVYPTEWKPANSWVETDSWEEEMKRGGKDGIATFSKKRVDAAEGWDGMATPTSFETRNLGLSCCVVPEEEMLRLEIHQVTEVGESVYHRVKVGDEWVADMIMPTFANVQVGMTIPRVPGGWQLVAANGEFLENGEPDREHRLLYFLKLE